MDRLKWDGLCLGELGCWGRECQGRAGSESARALTRRGEMDRKMAARECPVRLWFDSLQFQVTGVLSLRAVRGAERQSHEAPISDSVRVASRQFGVGVAVKIYIPF